MGRSWNAALCIDDARVSEAHALVSHREGALWLLSLRRMVAIGGESRSEVELQAGQEIQLADGVLIRVAYVVLPEVVLGLEGPGLGLRPLSPVSALRVVPRVELLARFDAAAALLFWSTGLGVKVRDLTGAVREVEPGDTFEVSGKTFRIVAMPGAASAATPTRADGAIDSPLRIVCRYDTVHLQRAGRPVVVLTGLQARLFSEVATVGCPVSWEVIASTLWPDADRAQGRRRWDVQVVRLRGRLRAAGISGDVIQSDGKGNVELVLGPQDVVVDET